MAYGGIEEQMAYSVWPIAKGHAQNLSEFPPAIGYKLRAISSYEVMK